MHWLLCGEEKMVIAAWKFKGSFSITVTMVAHLLVLVHGIPISYIRMTVSNS